MRDRKDNTRKTSKSRPVTASGADGWGGHLKAALVLVSIVLNLTFWICPLMVLVLLKWLLPFAGVQSAVYRMMAVVYQSAVRCDSWLLFGLVGIQLQVNGMAASYPQDFYLIMANHQSWSDILILQHLFNRRAPVMKFLVKRELIYLPLVGLICWAYDYPFLRRSSLRRPSGRAAGRQNDTNTLDRSLRRFMRSRASIVNFAEGTRYSAEKAHSQRSPFRYLLKPKTGGLSAILEMLDRRLHSIIDVTLVYDSPRPSFWKFISGKTRCVRVHIETSDMKNGLQQRIMTDGRVERTAAVQWLNELWELKDRKISRMREQF